MTPKRIVRPGVQAGYDLWAETYDSTPNPIVAADARITLQALAPQPGERILDAGCGTGRHLRPIAAAGARVIGLDFSAGMLRIASCIAPLVQADLQAPLPFRPHSFDAVLCSLIGEHLHRLDLALRYFREILAPTGRLVFSVYHPDLAAAGKEANFDRDGAQYRLGAVRHSLADYVNLTAAFFPDVRYQEFERTILLIQARVLA